MQDCGIFFSFLTYWCCSLASHRYPTWHHPLHWRHNDHDGVSNHQSHGCLLNRLFRRRSKKTSKLLVTGLVTGAGEFPAHKGPVTRKMFPFDDVIMIKGLLKKSEESINVIMYGTSYFQENKSVHAISFEIGTLYSYHFSNSLEKPLANHWCAWNNRTMLSKLRKLRKSVTVLFTPLQRFRVQGYFCTFLISGLFEKPEIKIEQFAIFTQIKHHFY